MTSSNPRFDSCRTGLLLLLFNRPDLTRELFSRLPPGKDIDHLFISIDGPRYNLYDTDKYLIELNLSLCETLKCSYSCLSIFRSPINLGCRQAIISAIDQCFNHVDQLIILEDDCLPSPSFFRFCQYHLEKHRDSRDIFSICGSSYLKQDQTYPTGAYYSKYGDSSGWATWKSKWNMFSRFPITYSHELFEQTFLKAGLSLIERQYWHSILKAQYSQKWNGVWDYQWFVVVWLFRGLHVVSTKVLVSNHGYRDDASHTSLPTSFAFQELNDDFDPTIDYQHRPHTRYDNYVFWHRRSGSAFFIRRYLTPIYVLIRFGQLLHTAFSKYFCR